MFFFQDAQEEIGKLLRGKNDADSKQDEADELLKRTQEVIKNLEETIEEEKLNMGIMENTIVDLRVIIQ